MLFLVSCSAGAQAPQNDPVHWAYASFFGIGSYSVDGARETVSFGFKPRRAIRAAELRQDGQRSPGITLRLPFSVGVHDLQRENVAQNLRLSNVSTISVVPGVEIEIPMSQRWRIKPLIHLGLGKQIDGGPSAWIYAAGFKSELVFPATRVNLKLINSLTYIGFTSRADIPKKTGNALPLLTGLEFSRSLAETRLGGDPLQLLWHVAHTRYLNELSFDDAGPRQNMAKIDDVWELGIGFRKAEQRLRLWRLSLDRVVVAFKAESGGGFRGVSIRFSSLFER